MKSEFGRRQGWDLAEKLLHGWHDKINIKCKSKSCTWLWEVRSKEVDGIKYFDSNYGNNK